MPPRSIDARALASRSCTGGRQTRRHYPGSGEDPVHAGLEVGFRENRLMDAEKERLIRVQIEHGLAQAARGEGMTVVEAKQRTMAAIMRVAEQEANLSDVLASGERIAERDARALRLLEE